MPSQIEIDATLFHQAAGKTVVITGAANGIGAATARLYNRNGANVVIGDLEMCRKTAEVLIESFKFPAQSLFGAVDVRNWQQMQNLFKQAIERFGSVDIVVANAGIMETTPTLDLDVTDDKGELLESKEAFKVLDVNVKGALNTIRLAMHHMRATKTRGSIVLVASTSGYFGGTGVVGYSTSKHAVVGLLRSSRPAADQYGIRINGVAPFFTPTHITASYSEDWKEAGLEANTHEGVASVIAYTSLDATRRGNCLMVAGRLVREVELTRTQLMPQWLGDDMVGLMGDGFRFFADLGGYPLPKERSSS